MKILHFHRDSRLFSIILQFLIKRWGLLRRTFDRRRSQPFDSSLKDFLIPPKAVSTRKFSRFLFVQSLVFVLSTHSADFRVPSHTLWSFRDDCVISQLTFNPLHPARTSLFNEIHRLFARWRIWRRKQTVRVPWGWRNRRVLTPFWTHFSWFGEYRWHHSGSSRFMIPRMISEKFDKNFYSTRAMAINSKGSSHRAVTSKWDEISDKTHPIQIWLCKYPWCLCVSRSWVRFCFSFSLYRTQWLYLF